MSEKTTLYCRFRHNEGGIRSITEQVLSWQVKETGFYFTSDIGGMLYIPFDDILYLELVPEYEEADES